ncbi:MAG: hypothetical protein E7329_12385 [Clostridiales bacterium]|nr:hypothetical protein [Clostridiales bacterium]
MIAERKITISSQYAKEGVNATPIISLAVQQLCLVKDGMLELEKGEYHLYDEGAYQRYLVATGFQPGVKNIAFPILNADGLTIEGNGATLISHGLILPFLVQCSKNVTIRNLISDTFHSPVSEFFFSDITEEGFTLKFANDLHLPHRLENGHVIFENEGLNISSEEKFLSLHSMERRCVQFLFAGDTHYPKDKLAASYFNTDAVDVAGGIRFLYRKNEPSAPCQFREGEKISILTSCGRVKSVLFLDRSEDTLIQNFTIVRSEAMGLVALMCRNVELDGYKLLRLRGNQVTSSADMIFMIHCTGKIKVHHCQLTGSEDDIINVHGIYSLVEEITENQLLARFQHPSQRHFNPYFPGDELHFIDGHSLEILGKATVESSTVVNPESGYDVLLNLKNMEGTFAPGCYIENPARLPDVEFCQNQLSDFPHVRLSGAGNIRIESNHLLRGTAILINDLVRYWYESGRVKSVVIRDNIFEDMKGDCINVGVPGFDAESTPKIHEHVILENNAFIRPKRLIIHASGLQKLTVANNIVDGAPLGRKHMFIQKGTEIL